MFGSCLKPVIMAVKMAGTAQVTSTKISLVLVEAKLYGLLRRAVTVAASDAKLDAALMNRKWRK